MAELFSRSFKKAMRDAEVKVDAIRASLDAELEAMAVNHFGVPDPKRETLFAPPSDPIRVRCWHCDGKYLSDKMRLQYRPRMQSASVEAFGKIGPLWWCKNSWCDGAGFGYDLHAIAPQSKRPEAKP